MSRTAPKAQVEQLYCSVDLEFTGFDPERDQILEIGFAFFRLGKNGFEVVEEWSQVFKPSIEVHPKILGLTGITQQELDEAPQFNEFREELQQKLGQAIIVGHNPIMDIKFLESYGLKLSGKVIDTLELVQFILPTHHSYNLENLVHYFGVKHHKAHRALGDALSTIQVLENLQMVYQQFSTKLKKELDSVIKRGDFAWRELLEAKVVIKKIEGNDSLSHTMAGKNLKPLILNKQLITIDDTPANHEARVALGLKDAKQSTVLAVSDSGMVMRLWQEGFAHGVFSSADTFSEKAFKKFLKSSSTSEELRFCLKVIVWLHTNWQTEVVFDLNISFFGGQFRQFIVGGEPTIKDESVIVLDYSTLETLINQSNESVLLNRELVICDIQSFEKYISTGFSTRLSWSSVLYSLRLIYNPETDFGNLKLKDEVISALLATDLFFGLVYMLLHKAMPGMQYATLNELIDNHNHIYSRLRRAAENLKEKMDIISSQLEQGALSRISEYLQTFFEEHSNLVKWIDIDERNLSFHSQPIDISEPVGKILKPFTSARFTETLTNQELLSYLVDRLGLDTEITELSNKSIRKSFDIEIQSTVLTPSNLLKIVLETKLPLVVVVPSAVDIKEFYNNYYKQIKQKASLFAQGYSGGGNKMFRNFSINPKSVLLVTADFMAKQNYLITSETIVFTGLPQLETNHPYIKALISHWESKHPELGTILIMGKFIAALKKLKLNDKVDLKVFTNGKNFDFVDNGR